MDRLSQERLARLVLDKLLDSGELRSVASERALALRVNYLPPLIRLDLPAEDLFLTLLSPTTREPAIAGLRDAVVRVVTHEERDHWVAVATDALELQVSLRERSRVMRVTPIYEPELNPTVGGALESLGEPRLRLSWEGRRGPEAWIFREGEGLATVPLGVRVPRLLIFEDEEVADAVVAHAYADCATAVEAVGGDRVRTEPARSRIPVSHDSVLHLRSPWFKPWQRSLRISFEVLGLARLGRPAIRFTSSEGDDRSWDRNREPTIELAAEIFLHAAGEDQVEIDNRTAEIAEVIWSDGDPLEVPAGASVSVQGSHLLGVKCPTAITWAASTGGFSAPPPRVVNLSGAVSSPVPERSAGTSAALFKFEERAALVFQDAVVLPRVAGDDVEVGVRSHMNAGFLAQVALDDCVGAKLRYALADGAGWRPWRHVRDVVQLGASAARLELVAAAQVAFAVPSFVRTLTTDPDDVWELGAVTLRLSAEGLDVEAGRDPAGAEVNGTVYHGSTRIPFQSTYRVRAGAGVFRIIREMPVSGAESDPSGSVSAATTQTSG